MVPDKQLLPRFLEATTCLAVRIARTDGPVIGRISGFLSCLHSAKPRHSLLPSARRSSGYMYMSGKNQGAQHDPTTKKSTCDGFDEGRLRDTDTLRERTSVTVTGPDGCVSRVPGKTDSPGPPLSTIAVVKDVRLLARATCQYW